MRCLIIDDEIAAHRIVENFIERIEHAKLVGKCFNAIEALSFLRRNQVDLIFLDIDMPEVNGFSFLKRLNKQPAVIVISAHSEYALKAYDFDVDDYLLKPVRFERFCKAMEKVLKKVGNPPSALEQNIQLKIDGELKTIMLDDIAYFQAMENYIVIHLVSGNKKPVVHLTMAALEKKLSGSNFIRTHKSFIVNKALIESIEGDNMIIHQTTIKIGITYRQFLSKEL